MATAPPLSPQDLKRHVGRRAVSTDVVTPGPANLLRLAFGFLIRPSCQPLGLSIEEGDATVNIRSNHGITDAGQGHALQPFAFLRAPLRTMERLTQHADEYAFCSYGPPLHIEERALNGEAMQRWQDIVAGKDGSQRSGYQAGL